MMDNNIENLQIKKEVISDGEDECVDIMETDESSRDLPNDNEEITFEDGLSEYRVQYTQAGNNKDLDSVPGESAGLVGEDVDLLYDFSELLGLDAGTGLFCLVISVNADFISTVFDLIPKFGLRIASIEKFVNVISSLSFGKSILYSVFRQTIFRYFILLCLFFAFFVRLNFVHPQYS
jgi:hypothetical protein